MASLTGLQELHIGYEQFDMFVTYIHSVNWVLVVLPFMIRNNEMGSECGTSISSVLSTMSSLQILDLTFVYKHLEFLSIISLGIWRRNDCGIDEQRKQSRTNGVRGSYRSCYIPVKPANAVSRVLQF